MGLFNFPHSLALQLPPQRHIVKFFCSPRGEVPRLFSPLSHRPALRRDLILARSTSRNVSRYPATGWTKTACRHPVPGTNPSNLMRRAGAPPFPGRFLFEIPGSTYVFPGSRGGIRSFGAFTAPKPFGRGGHGRLSSASSVFCSASMARRVLMMYVHVVLSRPKHVAIALEELPAKYISKILSSRAARTASSAAVRPARSFIDPAIPPNRSAPRKTRSRAPGGRLSQAPPGCDQSAGRTAEPIPGAARPARSEVPRASFLHLHFPFTTKTKTLMLSAACPSLPPSASAFSPEPPPGVAEGPECRQRGIPVFVPGPQAFPHWDFYSHPHTGKLCVEPHPPPPPVLLASCLSAPEIF